MQNTFPHNSYLAAALVLAAGGLALTCTVISGDFADMPRLTNVFADMFRIGMVALVCCTFPRPNR
jgi:hypothetical protein